MTASQSARRQYEHEMTYGAITLPRSEYGLALDRLKELSSLTEVCACIEHTRGMKADDEMAYLRQRIALHESQINNTVLADPAWIEPEPGDEIDEATDYQWSREPNEWRG